MESFEKLGLGDNILKAIKSEGFEKPTEIQEKAIPLALAKKDIIANSYTGSGKTLAFAASIIEHVKPKQGIQALVLTPTRELAEQVSEAIKKFSLKKVKVLSIYGGVKIYDQIKKIPQTEIVVGTPGRILDHLNRKTLTLKKVKTLVLDEFDVMLDMGFHRDVEAIIKACPKDRQTMLFSATFNYDIECLAKKYTNNAMRVSAESFVDSSKLPQVYYNIPKHLKFSLLVHLLKKEKSDLVMVFCNTRNNVDFIQEHLIENGIKAKAIHGGMQQKSRTRTLEAFHAQGIKVLICTDVAARGLDIKEVSHVYNYDLPKKANEYTHRIGRTARAGKEGKVINILASDDYKNFSEIMDLMGGKIKEEYTPKINVISIKRKPTFHKRGRFEQRGPRNRSFKGRQKKGPKRSHQRRRR